MLNKKTEIIVVDDEELTLSAMKLVLEKDYQVHAFHSPKEAERVLNERTIPLAIIDLNLEHISGLDVLRDWKVRFPETEILFCSGETRVEKAIECLRHGASDYIVKPFRKDDLLLIIQRTLEKQELKRKVEKLTPLVIPISSPVDLIADSKAMQEVLDKARLLKGQSHLNVMILGESGTGKEVLARFLHQQEGESSRPFVVVNMPAVPSSLMEAELFGSEKGAYTDSKTSRPGKFEVADNGDIFLDEIGDLPMETQAKILRTLQEKTVERVGSTKARKVQFRVISATNQPLADLMSNGRFREDLMYRLSDMVLWLPPLREHKEDIPKLVEHFIKKYSYGRPTPKISQSAMETMMQYHWPGNIRQLESTVKRALIFNRGMVIEKIDLIDPLMMNPASNKVSVSTDMVLDASNGFEGIVAHFEKKILEQMIQKHSGDKTAAMAELKLPRATFYRKLTQLNIS